MLMAVTMIVATLAAGAADVTGKWEGKIVSQRDDGTESENTALLILAQKDGAVTGTIGGDEADQHPITSGRIEGNRLVIDAKHTENGREYHLELTVENDEMKGTAKTGERTAQLHVKKRKS